MKNSILAATLCTFTLFQACKKDDTPKKTTCSSTIYGYYDTAHSGTSAHFGIIDPATGGVTVTGTFTAGLFSNTAAFNPYDTTYWTLSNGEYATQLIKHSLSGTTTVFSAPSGSTYNLQGLTYNPVMNKLIAVNQNTSPAEVVEIVASGSSYSISPLATLTGTPHCNYPVSATIENTGGNIFFTIIDHTANTFSIEKYTPGAPATTPLASGTGHEYEGLRYNLNDSMLYAMEWVSPSGPLSFVRINPATGVITTLGTVAASVNPEFFSAVIDHCTDHYIFTTVNSTFSGSTFYTFDMSGSLVSSVPVTGRVFQGLFEK